MSAAPEENFVLIIDDQQPNIDALQLILADIECTIIHTNNGKDVIELIQRYWPLVIILDNKLPDIDVFDLSKKIKSEPISCDIPILFTGVMVDPNHQAKYFQAGGVDYFVKPFNKDIVEPRVKTHLTLRQTQKKLEAANFKLEILAKTDGLTGIPNRHMFNSFLAEKWNELSGSGMPIAMILCDIDFFKKFNDGYGHHEGDECLITVANAINKITSPGHLFARYGGEEFAVIMPCVDSIEAEEFAVTIIEKIRELKIPHGHSEVSKYVSLSLGVDSILPDKSNAPKDLIVGADSALYKAKETGRDKVMTRKDNNL